jgi:hypothetical protein
MYVRMYVCMYVCLRAHDVVNLTDDSINRRMTSMHRSKTCM